MVCVFIFSMFFTWAVLVENRGEHSAYTARTASQEMAETFVDLPANGQQ